MLVLSFCANAAMAQWVSDPTVNTVISVPGELSQCLVKAKQTADGKIFVSWLKWEDGMNAYIKLQLLDKDGNPLWGQGGIYVSEHVTSTWTSDYAMEVTPDGCAVIVHSDSRKDPGNRKEFRPYAYKIDQEGNFLWGLDGVEIPCEGASGHAPKIGVTNAGSVFVGYTDTSDDYNTSEQIARINADGTLGWAQNLVLSGLRGNFIPCEEDDFILVWFNGGIQAMRYDSNGDQVWDETLTVEGRDFNGRVDPNVVPDGQDGFVITYQRFVNNSEIYNCLQRVTSEGEKAMGLQAVDISLEAGVHSSAGMGLDKDKEEILVFWDLSYANDHYLRVNKFTYNGDRLWSEDVVLDDRYMWGWATVDGIGLPDGSSVIVYGDYVGAVDINLTVQKLDSEGKSVWKKQLGKTCYVSKPKTIYTDEQVCVFWTDDRVKSDLAGNGEVYGQNVTYDGGFGPSAIETVQADDCEALLFYSASSGCLNAYADESGTLYLYDTCGSLLGTYPLVAGENTIPVQQLNAGLYVVRLNDRNAKVIIK